MDRQTIHEAFKFGMLPQAYLSLKYQILEEAKRLIDNDSVDFRTDGLYWVIPVIYEVEKIDGEWVCLCNCFRRFGFCEHSLAVQIKEAGVVE